MFKDIIQSTKIVYLKNDVNAWFAQLQVIVYFYLLVLHLTIILYQSTDYNIAS